MPNKTYSIEFNWIIELKIIINIFQNQFSVFVSTLFDTTTIKSDVRLLSVRFSLLFTDGKYGLIIK